MYIFIDESGDLGGDLSKIGTSRKFTLAMLVCEDEKTHSHVKAAVKKTLKRKINYNKKNRLVHELKGSHTLLSIKEYFLSLMPISGWCLYSITVDKEFVQSHLRTRAGKNRLYNLLTRELLTAFMPPEDLLHVSVVVDCSKNSADRRDFNVYIQTHLEIAFGLKTQIYIMHENSQNNPGLQAVDLFCWGIHRKKEYGFDLWFNRFELKIKTHSIYYP